MIDQNTICAEAWEIIRRINTGTIREGDADRLRELQASCECNTAPNFKDFTRDGEQCERCGRYAP